MSFIRTKKISGKRYAYLVRNSWKKRTKGSRQKVNKYLGKVISPEIVKDVDFFVYYDIKELENYLKKTKREIISDLIEFELIRYGFEKKERIVVKDMLAFDLKKGMFIDEEGNEERIVLEVNEGYLCRNTVNSLINFKRKRDEDDERDIGIRLAKCFLETGLKAPKEVFIAYFHKI